MCTSICILAVDFQAFPRRYCKAEKFGQGEQVLISQQGEAPHKSCNTSWLNATCMLPCRLDGCRSWSICVLQRYFCQAGHFRADQSWLPCSPDKQPAAECPAGSIRQVTDILFGSGLAGKTGLISVSHWIDHRCHRNIDTSKFDRPSHAGCLSLGSVVSYQHRLQLYTHQHFQISS